MARNIRYARNEDVHIAYEVVGDGPIDLVYAQGLWSNLEIMWDQPDWARYLNRLASFARLIVFDMRGIGLSDRGPEWPALELQMDDVRAVMDAAGSETAAMFGAARGATALLLFAATHPERTSGLVLYSASARTLRDVDYPLGLPIEGQVQIHDRFLEQLTSGRTDYLHDLAGEQSDALRSWWLRFQRLVASPSAFVELISLQSGFDVRSVLPSIQAPTLLLHRIGDRVVRPDHGVFIADRVPGAKYVELAGDAHLPFLGDQDSVLDEVQEFLTGARTPVETDRVLATVLFTDIVGSTEQAASVGDRRWRELLEGHNAVVRRELAAFRGREIDSAGDGFMAAFDGPARAIRCAQSIIDGVGQLGLRIRVGVHTGECELIGEKLGGIAVHIAARVAGISAPGEVLVSQTVRDLVAGSGIDFEDRGTFELKGVPESRRLFAVSA